MHIDTYITPTPGRLQQETEERGDIVPQPTQGIMTLGILPASQVTANVPITVDSSRPTWPQMMGMFDMRNFSVSMNCTAISGFFPEYQQHIDDRTTFVMSAQFPDMFRTLPSNWASQSYDMNGTRALVDNLIDKPWVYEPPGGLFSLYNGREYFVVLGPRHSSNQMGALGHPPTIKATNFDLVGWDSFETIISTMNSSEREWERWGTSLGGAYNSHDITFGEMESIQGGTFAGRYRNNVGMHVNLTNVYNSFSKLKANANNPIFADTEFPGSIAVAISATVTGIPANSSTPTTPLLDCMHKYREYHKLPKAEDPTNTTHVFKCTTRGPSGNNDRNTIAMILYQMKTGMNIPVSLKDIKLGPGNNLKKARFEFEFAVYVCAGGWTMKLSETQQVRHFDLGLTNTTTADWSNRMRVASVDFTVPRGSLGSTCVGSCRYTHCPNLGRQSQMISGSCSGRGNYFDKLQAGAEKLVSDFQLTTRETGKGEKYVIQKMIDTVTKIRNMSTGYAKLDQNVKNSVDTVGQALNAASRRLDEITALVSTLYSATDNKDKWQSEHPCIDLNRNVISEVYHDITSLHNDVITEFQRLIALTQTDSYKSATSGDLTAPDIPATIKTLNSAIANIDRTLRVLYDAANNATDGTTSHPEDDDKDDDAADNKDDANLDSNDGGGGLPKWAIYTMAGVGGLIVMGVVIGVTLKLKKKNG